jgi:hypothetical protein
MTTMSMTIRVSRDQVIAARALIELRGGEDKVDAWIVKVAHAEPQPRNGKES